MTGDTQCGSCYSLRSWRKRTKNMPRCTSGSPPAPLPTRSSTSAMNPSPQISRPSENWCSRRWAEGGKSLPLTLDFGSRSTVFRYWPRPFSFPHTLPHPHPPPPSISVSTIERVGIRQDISGADCSNRESGDAIKRPTQIRSRVQSLQYSVQHSGREWWPTCKLSGNRKRRIGESQCLFSFPSFFRCFHFLVFFSLHLWSLFYRVSFFVSILPSATLSSFTLFLESRQANPRVREEDRLLRIRTRQNGAVHSSFSRTLGRIWEYHQGITSAWELLLIWFFAFLYR